MGHVDTAAEVWTQGTITLIIKILYWTFNKKGLFLLGEKNVFTRCEFISFIHTAMARFADAPNSFSIK